MTAASLTKKPHRPLRRKPRKRGRDTAEILDWSPPDKVTYTKREEEDRRVWGTDESPRKVYLETMGVEEQYQLGFQLRCEGRYPEAREALQRVLAVDPNHANARWQMGLILQFFDGDFDGSFAALRDVVVQNPNHHAARYDMAMTMMMLGMMDEACEQFKLIAAADPGGDAGNNARKQMAYCP